MFSGAASLNPLVSILDSFVAHALYDIRLNPFLRGAKSRTPGGREQIREFDDKVREYLFEQDARWVAGIAYVPRSQRTRFRDGWREADRRGVDALHRHFFPRLQGNRHYHGFFDDPRFTRNYELEAVWRRNNGYWVVLYKKRS